jgi:ribosome-associated toxin RatA of RatAB toxin-antitoxin module
MERDREPQRRGVLKRSALGAIVVAALAVASASPARSSRGDSSAVAENAAARTPVTVTVTRASEGLEIVGRCRVVAPVAVAWEVLTDYDGIDHFVSSMRESRIVSRENGHLMVEQIAVGKVFLFHRELHVLLRVEEDSASTIRFADTLHRDFESYDGAWRIEPMGPEVEIEYRLQARPSRGVPDLIGRGIFRGTVRQLLSEVAAEIARRAEKRGTTGDRAVSAETTLLGGRP